MLKNILENNTNYIKSTSEIPFVQIGKQVWMKENLNIDKFRNGETIPPANTMEEWIKYGDQCISCWCYYKFDKTNGEKYGKLYNIYAVNDPRVIAPMGWHVPSEEEFNELINYAGGEKVAGIKLKSKNGWDTFEGWGLQPDEDGNGTDDFGFNLLPGGWLSERSFYGIGEYGSFWIKIINNHYEKAISFDVTSSRSTAIRRINIMVGLSVRCIKDY